MLVQYYLLPLLSLSFDFNEFSFKEQKYTSSLNPSPKHIPSFSGALSSIVKEELLKIYWYINKLRSTKSLSQPYISPKKFFFSDENSFYRFSLPSPILLVNLVKTVSKVQIFDSRHSDGKSCYSPDSYTNRQSRIKMQKKCNHILVISHQFPSNAEGVEWETRGVEDFIFLTKKGQI